MTRPLHALRARTLLATATLRGRAGRTRGRLHAHRHAARRRVARALRPAVRVTISFIASLAAIAVGFWMAWPPLGPIVGGALAGASTVLYALGTEQPS